MSLVLKTNPAGVDVPIDRLQKILDSKLQLGNWENLPRAYINPISDKGLVAETYVGNGEYRECFFDDDFDAKTFFLASEITQYGKGLNNTQNFAWIVQVKIDKIYPSIEHRSDEELRNDIATVFKGLTTNYNLLSIETGVENVYKEFERSKIKFDDMSGSSSEHVLRVNFELRFLETCCTDC